MTGQKLTLPSAVMGVVSYVLKELAEKYWPSLAKYFPHSLSAWFFVLVGIVFFSWLLICFLERNKINNLIKKYSPELDCTHFENAPQCNIAKVFLNDNKEELPKQSKKTFPAQELIDKIKLDKKIHIIGEAGLGKTYMAQGLHCSFRYQWWEYFSPLRSTDSTCENTNLLEFSWWKSIWPFKHTFILFEGEKLVDGLDAKELADEINNLRLKVIPIFDLSGINENSTVDAICENLDSYIIITTKQHEEDEAEAYEKCVLYEAQLYDFSKQEEILVSLLGEDKRIQIHESVYGWIKDTGLGQYGVFLKIISENAEYFLRPFISYPRVSLLEKNILNNQIKKHHLKELYKFAYTNLETDLPRDQQSIKRLVSGSNKFNQKIVENYCAAKHFCSMPLELIYKVPPSFEILSFTLELILKDYFSAEKKYDSHGPRIKYIFQCDCLLVAYAVGSYFKEFGIGIDDIKEINPWVKGWVKICFGLESSDEDMEIDKRFLDKNTDLKRRLRDPQLWYLSTIINANENKVNDRIINKIKFSTPIWGEFFEDCCKGNPVWDQALNDIISELTEEPKLIISNPIFLGALTQEFLIKHAFGKIKPLVISIASDALKFNSLTLQSWIAILVQKNKIEISEELRGYIVSLLETSEIKTVPSSLLKWAIISKIPLLQNELIGDPFTVSISPIVEIGNVYEGTVLKLLEIGAIVSLIPGKDGLVHKSEVSDQHVKHVAEFLKVGDVVKVKVVDIEENGRVRLSIKALIKRYRWSTKLTLSIFENKPELMPDVAEVIWRKKGMGNPLGYGSDDLTKSIIIQHLAHNPDWVDGLTCSSASEAVNAKILRPEDIPVSLVSRWVETCDPHEAYKLRVSRIAKTSDFSKRKINWVNCIKFTEAQALVRAGIFNWCEFKMESKVKWLEKLSLASTLKMLLTSTVSWSDLSCDKRRTALKKLLENKILNDKLDFKILFEAFQSGAMPLMIFNEDKLYEALSGSENPFSDILQCHLNGGKLDREHLDSIWEKCLLKEQYRDDSHYWKFSVYAFNLIDNPESLAHLKPYQSDESRYPNYGGDVYALKDSFLVLCRDPATRFDIRKVDNFDEIPISGCEFFLCSRVFTNNPHPNKGSIPEHLFEHPANIAFGESHIRIIRPFVKHVFDRSNLYIDKSFRMYPLSCWDRSQYD